jgi:hypothetical protein
MLSCRGSRLRNEETHMEARVFEVDLGPLLRCLVVKVGLLFAGKRWLPVVGNQRQPVRSVV